MAAAGNRVPHGLGHSQEAPGLKHSNRSRYPVADQRVGYHGSGLGNVVPGGTGLGPRKWFARGRLCDRRRRHLAFVIGTVVDMLWPGYPVLEYAGYQQNIL